MTKELRCPDLPESDHGMSNLDQSIDAGLEADLKNGMIGIHAAWNFNGRVWFEDGMFHEDVWRYRSYSATFSAETLRDLMNTVNDQYGYE